VSTRHLVDSELLPMLEQFPTLALSSENLQDVRQEERELVAQFPIDDADREAVSLQRQTIPGGDAAPDIEVAVYTPRAIEGPKPCIFHIHGGGFVAGASALLQPFHYPLVHELGCVLASVDYRLAPETTFPGGVEDCYKALAWLNDNVGMLDVDPERIGVMGESAGGGLAAALALMVRDRGEYALAFQHLIYPMLDDRTCVTDDPNPVTGEFIWTPHNNQFGWSSLLGHEPGIAGVSEYAAPARATDLAGLPPTFIAVPTLDLFLEEDVTYAHRLMRAGVAVELHVYPGGFHAFDLHPTARLSEQARRDSHDALRRALYSDTTWPNP
jgi:triacylglycerol lipase